MKVKSQEEQDNALLELLWEYLPEAHGYSGRVETGWGTKTQKGLVASIRGILDK